MTHLLVQEYLEEYGKLEGAVLVLVQLLIVQ